jgi:glucuronokinase
MAADGSEREYDRAAVSDKATGVTHARAALLGNPSDGFGGATIAFELPHFAAVVDARESESILIEAYGLRLDFPDAGALVAAGRDHAYPAGGPAALLMATAKRFCERLADPGGDHASIGFELRLRSSSIPPQVGLAGSSAIVIAGLRALCELFAHEIKRELLPGFALACETEELGIAAGLQDRVVQTYGGLVFMDFDPALFKARGYGDYAQLDPELLPPLVVAYKPDAAGDSGVAHAPMHQRFDAGEPEVVETMATIAEFAHEGRAALQTGDRERLGSLMDRNFELRQSIYELDPRHTAMIDAARSVGAAANFAGSGGAVVALPAAGAPIDELRNVLAGMGGTVVVPGAPASGDRSAG